MSVVVLGNRFDGLYSSNEWLRAVLFKRDNAVWIHVRSWMRQHEKWVAHSLNGSSVTMANFELFFPTAAAAARAGGDL